MTFPLAGVIILSTAARWAGHWFRRATTLKSISPATVDLDVACRRESKSMNIYVGNLPFGITEAELQTAFAAHGAVTQVKVITDQNTGRSRGFAFVEMDDDAEAQAAIDALNESEMGDRKIVVNKARPKSRDAR